MAEVEQEEICDYCLAYILEREYSCTIHFQCEGRFCDQAREEYLEDLREEPDC